MGAPAPLVAQAAPDRTAIVRLLAAELDELPVVEISANDSSSLSLAQRLAELTERPFLQRPDTILPTCTGMGDRLRVGYRVSVGNFVSTADTIASVSLHHRCSLLLPPKAQRILQRLQVATGESLRYSLRRSNGSWSLRVVDRVVIN